MNLPPLPLKPSYHSFTMVNFCLVDELDRGNLPQYFEASLESGDVHYGGYFDRSQAKSL